jgi:L-ascorbate metabolism protein UlaG (beta-lactamase superfamily)
VRISKLGHSCLLVEEGETRLLIDPGTLGHDFTGETGLAAVLITHQHADHLDVERLPTLLERNPDATLITDEGSAEQLAERGIKAQIMREGDSVDVGVEVRALGREHAVIHPDLPVVPNVGYVVGGRLFHPGDAFTVPDFDVEVLAVPSIAPWMKISEAIEYLRTVRPRYAVPVHDGLLVNPAFVHPNLRKLAPEGTTLHPLDDATTLEV